MVCFVKSHAVAKGHCLTRLEISIWEKFIGLFSFLTCPVCSWCPRIVRLLIVNTWVASLRHLNINDGLSAVGSSAHS